MSFYYILFLFCKEHYYQSNGFPGRHIGSATAQSFILFLKSRRLSSDRFTQGFGNNFDRNSFNYLFPKDDIYGRRTHCKHPTKGMWKNCKTAGENTSLHKFASNSYLLTPTPFLFLGSDDVSKIILCVIFSAPILILALGFFIYAFSGRFDLRFFLFGIIHMIFIHFLVIYFLF